MGLFEQIQGHATRGGEDMAGFVGQFVGHRTAVGMTASVNPRRVEGDVGADRFNHREDEIDVVDAHVLCLPTTPSCVPGVLNTLRIEGHEAFLFGEHVELRVVVEVAVRASKAVHVDEQRSRRGRVIGRGDVRQPAPFVSVVLDALVEQGRLNRRGLILRRRWL